MKIEAFYNKKEKKQQYRCRFQFNRKEYFLTADTRKELNELVDEIRVQERREKRGIAAPESGDPDGPTFAELFAAVLPTIEKPHHKTFCERVFENFVLISPKGIRVVELKKRHFQKYVAWRVPQKNRQTKKPVKMTTVYKELYAVRGAFSKGDQHYDELEEWTPPNLPKYPEKKKSRQLTRRKRIVSKDDELNLLLEYLREPRSGKQTDDHHFHRIRLAHSLEFRYETGLRRKEVAWLERKKYYPKENVLRDVIRWKTDTITNFFPLTTRAQAIIEERLLLQPDTTFIFSPDGKPIESEYRTLKNACATLGITYGRYKEDGFILHDLRHNFATEIIQNTDIETARELLGHSNIGQTGDYLHTNELRMRDAMRKREGIDKKTELTIIWKDVRRRKMRLKDFIEIIKKIT